MTRATVVRVLAIFLGLLVAANLISALTAANTVPSTRLGNLPADAIDVNKLKPNDCDGITLTGITTGSGSISATNDDDLILGSPDADSLNARNGDDCLLGGAGNDSLNGGVGRDVCLGGPGDDTFTNACETRIQ